MGHIKLGIIGFSSQEQDKVDKILQLSRSRDRVYARGDITNGQCVDFLLVNRDTSGSQTQEHSYLQNHPDTPVVVVSKTPSNQATYFVKLPLIGLRVLRELDRVQLPAVTETGMVGAQQKPEPVRPVPQSQPATQRAVQTAKPEQKPVSAPQPESVHAQVDQSRQQPAEPEPSGERVFQVLVVDDSPTMQKALQLELAQSAIAVQVDCVESGEAALEHVGQKAYDFIFLDVMMPGIDGYETCTGIRKRPDMKKTPIIMLSAKTSPLDEVKGIMAGSTTYLTKPIKHEEFQRLIERVAGWLGSFSGQETESS